MFWVKYKFMTCSQLPQEIILTHLEELAKLAFAVPAEKKLGKFRMKSSSVERDEFSAVAWRLTGIQQSG